MIRFDSILDSFVDSFALCKRKTHSTRLMCVFFSGGGGGGRSGQGGRSPRALWNLAGLSPSHLPHDT